jgi:NADH-quinone oxidoreductase subunit D
MKTEGFFDLEFRSYSPTTHGIFQNILLMDGANSRSRTNNRLHSRAFEKIAENRPFYQITPLTDRMNYCSSPINNMGWWMTLKNYLILKYLNVLST